MPAAIFSFKEKYSQKDDSSLKFIAKKAIARKLGISSSKVTIVTACLVCNTNNKKDCVIKGDALIEGIKKSFSIPVELNAHVVVGKLFYRPRPEKHVQISVATLERGIKVR